MNTKDEIKRRFDLREPTAPSSKSVLSRNKYHKTATLIIYKYLPWVKLISFTLATLMIAAPAVNIEWREFITEHIITISIFNSLAHTKLWVMFLTMLGLPIGLYSQKQVDNKGWSDYGYPFNIKGIGATEIYTANLWPRTKREEAMFWIDRYYDIYMATIWPFLVVGIISYAIS